MPAGKIFMVRREHNLQYMLWSIYNRKVLFVCLSRKMITLPNGLKSSSLAVAISLSKHCNTKMFSMNCTCQQKNFLNFLFFKTKFLNLQRIGEKREKMRNKWWETTKKVRKKYWKGTSKLSKRYRVSLKKGTFLIFCLISVLEVGFYFFTCVSESEFWARFI